MRHIARSVIDIASHRQQRPRGSHIFATHDEFERQNVSLTDNLMNVLPNLRPNIDPPHVGHPCLSWLTRYEGRASLPRRRG